MSVISSLSQKTNNTKPPQEGGISVSGTMESFQKLASDKLLTPPNYNPLISDVFLVNPNLPEFEVRKAEDSIVLKWHFPWFPIVPWAVSRSIYKTRNAELGNSLETTFINMVMPWDKLKIDGNYLMKQKWEDWVNVALFSEFESDAFYDIELPTEHPHTLSESEIDKFLLQSGDFRFANGELKMYFLDNANLSVWDIFTWTCSTQWIKFEKDWNVLPELFDEIVAQVLSTWAWYILNWNSVNKKDTNFRILTYASSRINDVIKDVKIWERLICIWKIIKVDKRGISVQFCLKKEDGTIIQHWTITWNIMKLWLLKKICKN